MKYSFIVPVYNCETYLEECVQSVLAIGVSDYEVILVDDGSTDDSGKLCDELSQRHSQVQVIHQKNCGVSAARNQGFQKSEGEFILFLDADDSIEADMLRDVLQDSRCHYADMTIFGVSFDYYYHGRHYRSDSLYYEFNGIMTKEQWGNEFCQLFLKNSLSPLWNKVFRRDLLKQLQFNTQMFLYEDLEFVLRAMQYCSTIFTVPKAIYHYRQAEDESNLKRRLRRINSIPDFLQPLELALIQLHMANPAVSKETVRSTLLYLHLVLAREKISVSKLSEIRSVCEEFATWSRERNIPCLSANKFHRRLLKGKAVTLFVADKKSSLRHKIAVWAKGTGLYR